MELINYKILNLFIYFILFLNLAKQLRQKEQSAL
jgi:hypothetical protein